jgi:hypothetical protein
MIAVRERWLSKRAITLHLAVLVFVPGCAVAAWWQVNRAEDGNQLSYLYSVMWPAFGILAIVFWWVLVHTDYETVGLKGTRRLVGPQEVTSAAHTSGSFPPIAAVTAPTATSVTGTVPTTSNPRAPVDPPAPVTADEDPELAAYNARLAELAAKGPKTWRNRESVVARRPQ